MGKKVRSKGKNNKNIPLVKKADTRADKPKVIAVICPITFKDYAEFQQGQLSEDKRQDIEEFIAEAKELRECLALETEIDKVLPHVYFLGGEEALKTTLEVYPEVELDEHCLAFIQTEDGVTFNDVTDVYVSAHGNILGDCIGSKNCHVSVSPESLGDELNESFCSEDSENLPKITIFACYSAAHVFDKQEEKMIDPFSQKLGNYMSSLLPNFALSIAGYETPVATGSYLDSEKMSRWVTDFDPFSKKIPVQTEKLADDACITFLYEKHSRNQPVLPIVTDPTNPTQKEWSRFVILPPSKMKDYVDSMNAEKHRFSRKNL
jgi:hypothetical protein